MRRTSNEVYIQTFDLSRVTIAIDQNTGDTTVTGIPYDVLRGLITKASLYTYDDAAELEAQSTIDPKGPYPHSYPEQEGYIEEQHRVHGVLDAHLSAAIQNKPYRPNERDTSSRALLAAEPYLSMETRRIDAQIAAVDTPLPDYPSLNLLVEARSHTRRAIRLLGHVAQGIIGMLRGNDYHNPDTSIGYLREIAVSATLAADTLERYKSLPDDNLEISVKRAYPEPWESTGD